MKSLVTISFLAAILRAIPGSLANPVTPNAALIPRAAAAQSTSDGGQSQADQSATPGNWSIKSYGNDQCSGATLRADTGFLDRKSACKPISDAEWGLGVEVKYGGALKIFSDTQCSGGSQVSALTKNTACQPLKGQSRTNHPAKVQSYQYFPPS